MGGGLIQSEFKPKDGLVPIFLFDVEGADIAADFGGGRGEVEAFKEGAKAFISVAEFLVAESEGAAGAYFIFGPAVAEQKIFENGGSCIVQPAVGQLPCEVIFLPLVRHRTVGERMGEDKEVSAAAFVVAAQVCDGDIAAFGIGIDADGFMHGAFPEEAGVFSDDTFSEEESSGVAERIERGVVAEEVGVDGAVEAFFEVEQFFLIVVGDDIVGV